MKELSGTTYDEATDGASPVMPGTYPAHVSAFEGRTVQTKFGEQRVFNVEFQIAEEDGFKK